MHAADKKNAPRGRVFVCSRQSADDDASERDALTVIFQLFVYAPSSLTYAEAKANQRL